MDRKSPHVTRGIATEKPSIRIQSGRPPPVRDTTSPDHRPATGFRRLATSPVRNLRGTNRLAVTYNHQDDADADAASDLDQDPSLRMATRTLLPDLAQLESLTEPELRDTLRSLHGNLDQFDRALTNSHRYSTALHDRLEAAEYLIQQLRRQVDTMQDDADASKAAHQASVDEAVKARDFMAIRLAEEQEARAAAQRACEAAEARVVPLNQALADKNDAIASLERALVDKSIKHGAELARLEREHAADMERRVAARLVDRIAELERTSFERVTQMTAQFQNQVAFLQREYPHELLLMERAEAATRQAMAQVETRCVLVESKLLDKDKMIADAQFQVREAKAHVDAHNARVALLEARHAEAMTQLRTSLQDTESARTNASSSADSEQQRRLEQEQRTRHRIQELEQELRVARDQVRDAQRQALDAIEQAKSSEKAARDQLDAYEKLERETTTRQAHAVADAVRAAEQAARQSHQAALLKVTQRHEEQITLLGNQWRARVTVAVKEAEQDVQAAAMQRAHAQAAESEMAVALLRRQQAELMDQLQASSQASMHEAQTKQRAMQAQMDELRDQLAASRIEALEALAKMEGMASVVQTSDTALTQRNRGLEREAMAATVRQANELESMRERFETEMDGLRNALARTEMDLRRERNESKKTIAEATTRATLGEQRADDAVHELHKSQAQVTTLERRLSQQADSARAAAAAVEAMHVEQLAARDRAATSREKALQREMEARIVEMERRWKEARQDTEDKEAARGAVQDRLDGAMAHIAGLEENVARMRGEWQAAERRWMEEREAFVAASSAAGQRGRVNSRLQRDDASIKERGGEVRRTAPEPIAPSIPQARPVSQPQPAPLVPIVAPPTSQQEEEPIVIPTEAPSSPFIPLASTAPLAAPSAAPSSAPPPTSRPVPPVASRPPSTRPSPSPSASPSPSVPQPPLSRPATVNESSIRRATTALVRPSTALVVPSSSSSFSSAPVARAPSMTARAAPISEAALPPPSARQSLVQPDAASLGQGAWRPVTAEGLGYSIWKQRVVSARR